MEGREEQTTIATRFWLAMEEARTALEREYGIRTVYECPNCKGIECRAVLMTEETMKELRQRNFKPDKTA